MDLFKSLNENADYSHASLQLILGAWVLSSLFEEKEKVALDTGDVSEDDYDKQSVYSLLYALYRSMGEVRSDTGTRYEFTFNTWGYAWPKEWGPCPTTADDPQRFGKNAYAGLFHFAPLQEMVRARDGAVHIVELGCGTGAGAHYVCKSVLPKATYTAVDMQLAAIRTCQRKFVPELRGRLTALHANATKLPLPAGSADIVAVCETHVTEHAGKVTAEDQAFLSKAHDLLKPGGYMVWGNAIPDSTWEPSFEYLKSIGLRRVESADVTEQAVEARDLDRGRISAYVAQCIERFKAFRIPYLGRKKETAARLALENFARNPGTNLYVNMQKRTDTYRVSLLEKVA